MKKLKSAFIFLKNPIGNFRKSSIRNRILIIICLIIIALFVNSVLRANKVPDYEKDTVKKGSITQIVSETGNVKSAGRVDVSSTTTGIIEEIYTNNGDSVTTGQNLFKVRAIATEQEKASAYAGYLSAKSTLDAANAMLFTLQSQMFTAWDKYKELAESDEYANDDGTAKTQQRTLPEFHIPEKDWFAAEAKYKNQQAVIKQAEAAVNAAFLAYQATQNSITTSPTSGTVANLSVNVGDSVQAGGNAQAALLTGVSPKPVLTVANVSQDFSVELTLNETDIPKVKEGQKAKIEVDALGDRQFDGIVTHVDSIGTDNSGVITYNVVISLLGTDTDIRPGMTVGIEIEVDRRKDVLTVSSSAIKPYKGGRAVRVYDKKTKKIDFIPVTPGIKGDSRTEIKKGLTEGQEIVVSLPNEEISRPGLFGN